MIVANRTLERARCLAAPLGGYAIPLSQVGKHLEEADIVVTAVDSGVCGLVWCTHSAVWPCTEALASGAGQGRRAVAARYDIAVLAGRWLAVLTAAAVKPRGRRLPMAIVKRALDVGVAVAGLFVSELVKKSTALGISRSGGARNPHVFQHILRFLRSGGTGPFARDDFFTSSPRRSSGWWWRPSG